MSSCEYFPVVILKTHVGVPHKTDSSHTRCQMEILYLLTNVCSFVSCWKKIGVYTLSVYTFKLKHNNISFIDKYLDQNQNKYLENAEIKSEL